MIKEFHTLIIHQFKNDATLACSKTARHFETWNKNETWDKNFISGECRSLVSVNSGNYGK